MPRRSSQGRGCASGESGEDPLTNVHRSQGLALAYGLVGLCLAALCLAACSSPATTTTGATTSSSRPGATKATAATTPQIPADTAPCSTTTLAAQGGRKSGGSVGEAEGTVILTNKSGDPCFLRGIPSVTLLRSDGSLLGVESVAPKNPALPPLLLQPTHSAVLVVYWANWCGSPPGPLQVRITPAGGAGSLTGSFDGPPDSDSVPTCTNGNKSSTLTVVHAYGAGSSS